MYAVGTAARDGVEDRRGVEVALRGGLAAQGVRLVCQPDVQRVAVEFRVDGDRRDAELAGSSRDTHRDLAAVGDEDLLQHARQCRVRAVPAEHGAQGGTERTTPASPAEWPAGWFVEHVAATGSTNDDLLASASDRPNRSVLVADYQHAGRGRRDRMWTAMPGENLLASILFHEVPIRGDGTAPSRVGRRRRRVSAIHLRTAGVEVAQRRAARRSQARRGPRPTRRQRKRGGRNRSERRLGARRRQSAGPGRHARRVAHGRSWRRTTSCRRPPTTCVTATAASWRRSGGGCGSSCQTASCSAWPPTLPSTAASSSIDDAGTAHRLSVGDVVHLRVQ